jgi:hypothetical protein
MTPDASLGVTFFTTGLQLVGAGWIEGVVVKRNVDHRMKIVPDIIVVKFFVFYKHDDDTSDSI